MYFTLLKITLTLCMNNYFTFSHSQELTYQCAVLWWQTFCLKECWFTKQRGGKLTPQSNGPDFRSVLRPFAEVLRVDKELKLSSESFIQSIEDFFRHKHITSLSQLTATPAFPTPHVLAQFASRVYRNYKIRQTDAQYETRLALPDGWKLLKTASNERRKNGYFGAAY